MKYYKQ